ncbi:DUF3305 domain-containing protein [Vibrio brasiliensis]|jgi:hypothetical protein|uniref:DUF3305 domain-containing protein n=1 Tax=Vibrio brasiliensis LMG 20546 TaxID=945543 RepID=E8LSY1_9VIBR|nr:DUF3305 domain-containing protein [Vibrio brasiliensis]EGA66174.1 hypothetical protein VIBR0546_00375 [Vibrio brasiliensis LMG 20546]MCG9648363.1 DUF3305 domain-containing protein [Vibrio brasiliensis]MCG9724869.1 DUF3305 domain-containing protein [Vibrio brasiliensis]MCG9752354.1 DUF3305 domain-containing protein [Vibrio brasiliensis]MCG9783097.1 DUF3305 domain-containing protein [Vibrio brasiliensis]
MPKQQTVSEKLEKTQQLWPIECKLITHEISTGLWTTTQWQLAGFELQPESQHDRVVALQLHRDERTDYRFNLSSQQPKLFLVLDTMESDEQPNIVTLTASQSVAGQYMDGDYLVLSNDMPLAVQAWMEAYIGRNGELLEQRRKKRKGAGRASGN